MDDERTLNEENTKFNPEDFEEDEDDFFFEDTDEESFEFYEEDVESDEQESEEKEDFSNENEEELIIEADNDDDVDLPNNGDDDEDSVPIGLDLGTTNSVISFIGNNGAATVVKVKNDALIPSFIFFKDKDTVYFGKKAKSYAKAMSEGASVSCFKKHLRADSEKIKVKVRKNTRLSENNKRHFVIDTNVLIDMPNILSTFKEDDVIILPITVIEELKYRRGDVSTKYSAEEALKEIVDLKDRIIFEESDETLLPDDFFKTFVDNYNNANNDNKILSIALKYKNEGAVLISSDNQLAKLKADFVGINGITLKEYNIGKFNESDYDEFELTGTEASTIFLRYLKQEAEKFIKKPVNKAVITVPATFNIVEIENTRKAGLDAGFKEIHIEKEPTAAAIAYNIDAKIDSSTFVYDFGGGTFDVSIIKSDGNGNFDVCATAGNAKLGGEDLTKKVEEFVYDYLEDNYDLSMYDEDESGLTTEHYAYNSKTIYWAAENCKMELSGSEYTQLTLLDIYLSNTEQKSVIIDMSRSEFESQIKPTINSTIVEMNNGLSKADMMISDIDNIILAGGTSLIPCIQSQVEKYFGRKPSSDKNAATLIAEGAAIIADAKYGKNHLIKMQPKVFDMTYEDFGVALEKWNYGCIIPAGTTLPAVTEKKYSLVEDFQSQLNIKIFLRKSDATHSLKTFDTGVEFLDELIMSKIPPMKMDEVDVIVRFEITKQYELKTDVILMKKDGTIVDKGNLSINRQSTL